MNITNALKQTLSHWSLAAIVALILVTLAIWQSTQAQTTCIATVPNLISTIETANANGSGLDTIELCPDTIFTLTSPYMSTENGLPEITTEIVINGNGSTIERDTSAPGFRIFQIPDSGNLTIDGLTVSRGDIHDDGGGILNLGTLTISNSTLSGNRASKGGGGIYNVGTLTISNSTVGRNAAGHGGGIQNDGTLTISNSTVGRNQADINDLTFNSRNLGGGIYNTSLGMLSISNSTLWGNDAGGGFERGRGGGIYNEGILTLSNSTLSSNLANLDPGGGIYNVGTLIINSSTLWENSAFDGGGIYHEYNNGNGLAIIKDSIVANSGGDCFAIAFSGTNLETVSTDATCPGFTTVSAPQLNLGGLADNGGPTQTHALLPGSVAIDAASDCLLQDGTSLTSDQRGFPRPVDGDGDGTATCDVGAFEVQTSAPPSNTAPVAADDPDYSTDEDTPLTINTDFGVLANDSDADLDSLTAIKVSDPTNGSVTLNADGSFTYEPNANFNGTDTFTYKANDGTADSNIATVTITVNAASACIQTVPDLIGAIETANSNGPGLDTLDLCPDIIFTLTSPYGATENGLPEITTEIVINGNSSTIERDPSALAFRIFHVAIGGNLSIDELTISGNMGVGGISNRGVLTISNSTLSDNDTGDGGGIYNTGTAEISGSTLSGNGSFTGGGGIYNDRGRLYINDSTLSDNAAPVGGGIFNDGGTLYINNSTLSGNTAQDAFGEGSGGGIYTFHGSVSISSSTLLGNRNQSSIYNENGHIVFSNSIVAGTINGSDCSGEILATSLNFDTDGTCTGFATVTSEQLGLGSLDHFGGPTQTHALLEGSVAIDAASDCLLLPDGTPLTSDQRGFPRPVDGDGDGTATCDVGAFEVQTSAPPSNAAPVAADDPDYSTDEDSPLTINADFGVLENDTDADMDSLTAIKVSDPTNGSVTLNADGSFTYEPNTDFNGTDTFTYKANDGTADSNIATVTITVRPINDAPLVVNDTYDVDEDSSLNANVLENDSDVDGDTLAATLVDDVTNGTLTLNADGSFTYIPGANYFGSDSFTYNASDGTVLSEVASVSITVKPVNDAPTAVEDSASLNEDASVVVTVLDNDSDVDGDMLTVSGASAPLNGTATVNPDGTVTYEPNADFCGLESFTYNISDGNGGTASASLVVTVVCVNDPPVASDDTPVVDEDNVLNGNVLANDTDIEGDTLTTSLVSDVSNGELTLNTDGSFSYLPDLNFHGSDGFTYQANDGVLDSAIATASITINPVNDPPTISSPGDQFHSEGAVISLALTASDVEDDTLTYSASGLPSGLTIDPVSGLISGTLEPATATGSPYTVTVTVADTGGLTASATFTWTVNPKVVQIDIKPGETPNCVNNNGYGVIPVAILGSAELDVSQVIVASIELEGLLVQMVGEQAHLQAQFEDINGDGFTDLMVQIADEEGAFAPDATTATLTGTLFNDTHISGSDSVCIVPPQ